MLSDAKKHGPSAQPPRMNRRRLCIFSAGAPNARPYRFISSHIYIMTLLLREVAHQLLRLSAQRLNRPSAKPPPPPIFFRECRLMGAFGTPYCLDGSRMPSKYKIPVSRTHKVAKKYANLFEFRIIIFSKVNCTHSPY